MIKNITLSTLISLCCLSGYSQWTKIDLSDKISVSFPSVSAESIQRGESYFSYTSVSCNFLGSVQKDFNPYYKGILNKPINEQKTRLEIFFNVFVQKYKTKCDKIISSRQLNIQGYNGYDLDYWVKNSYTNLLEQQYMRLILINNELYSFICTYYDNSTKALTEKNKFFNSIIIK